MTTTTQQVLSTGTLFAGLSHQARGNTKLSLEGGSLLVQGLGPSPDMGLRVALGKVQGFIPEIELPAKLLRPGAVLVSRTQGRVDGQEDQPSASLTFEAVEGGVRLTPDFSSIGAPTYELQLFLAGELVHRQAGMSGPAGTALGFANKRRKVCCRVLVYSGSFLTPEPFLTIAGEQVMADNVYFIRENPRRRVDYLTSVTYESAGIPELRLTGEEIAAFDPFIGHSALAGSAFSSRLGRLNVENRGGRPGVTIDWKKARSFQASLELAGVSSAGPALQLTTSGTFGGLPEGAVGTVRLLGCGKATEVEFEFQGAASAFQLEIRLAGEVVSRGQHRCCDKISLATELARLEPTFAASLNGGSASSPWSAALSFGTSTQVRLPDGRECQGDEIVAFPETAAAPTRDNALTTLQVEANGIDDVIMVDECVERLVPAGPVAAHA